MYIHHVFVYTCILRKTASICWIVSIYTNILREAFIGGLQCYPPPLPQFFHAVVIILIYFYIFCQSCRQSCTYNFNRKNRNRKDTLCIFGEILHETYTLHISSITRPSRIYRKFHEQSLTLSGLSFQINVRSRGPTRRVL